MKMNRTDTISKLLVLLLIALTVLSLTACGTKGGDKMDGMSDEPRSAEEATAIYKESMAQENTILSEDAALWKKIFMAVDKGATMQEDGKNYGNFLLNTIESAKDQFTAGELKLAQGEAEKIRDIGDKLTMIEKKYSAMAQESLGGSTGTSAGNGMTTSSGDDNMQKLPALEGKDLDGNTVKGDELFFGNAVTVVNLQFTICNPYVGELAELDALNKELAEKSGEIIDINAFTLDSNETAISKAKDVLSKKDATYRNVYSPFDGEAGRFTTNVFVYPTAYVVDRDGNTVGGPIAGAITGKTQAEVLQAQIDKALSTDMG